MMKSYSKVLSVGLLLLILLIACTQKTKEIKVVNQTNQKNTTAVTISTNQIQTTDIEVTNLSLKSTSFQADYPIKVIVEVKNDEAPLSDVVVAIYDNDDLIKQYKIALKSFEMKKIELEWVPKYTGKHYIRAIADPENLVKEKNEINNRIELDIEIKE